MGLSWRKGLWAATPTGSSSCPTCRSACCARSRTALHQAALTDDVALVDVLLARGAPTDARDRMWNATPLQWAIHEGRERARERLTAV
jgi:hypothetical protein